MLISSVFLDKTGVFSVENPVDSVNKLLLKKTISLHNIWRIFVKFWLKYGFELRFTD